MKNTNINLYTSKSMYWTALFLDMRFYLLYKTFVIAVNIFFLLKIKCKPFVIILLLYKLPLQTLAAELANLDWKYSLCCLLCEGSKIFSESTVIDFIHIMENVDINRYFKSKKAWYFQGQNKQNNIIKIKQKKQQFHSQFPNCKSRYKSKSLKKRKIFILYLTWSDYLYEMILKKNYLRVYWNSYMLYINVCSSTGVSIKLSPSAFARIGLLFLPTFILKDQEPMLVVVPCAFNYL